MNCPTCQQTNADNARFCSNCGATLAAPRPAEGERKLVTVLFADVVGSTEMGEQLDPEQITEIMNGGFALFNAAVSRYGGTVARLMGDAVLALFGAPAAHEDDAERGVRAGLAIAEAAQGYGKVVAERYGAPFQVRVGINTGLAVLTTVGDDVRAEYTAMGDTANVASRMQTAARPGTVLISADTYHFVQRLFDLTPRGAIEVKGKSAPLETYEVVAAKAVPGSVRGIEGITSPLVGRDAELQQLRTTIRAATEGRGSFLAIAGEAGLGKSRLIAEIRAWTHDVSPSATWLEGRAISYGQTLAYYPWRQIVRQAIGVREIDSPEATREALGRALEEYRLPDEDRLFLETMLAVESEATTVSLAELMRLEVVQGVADAVRRFLSALATPLVLVFDDLHWADTASLELLSAICTVVADRPVVLIGVSRPDRAAPGWSTLERIEELVGERFSRVELAPLSAGSAQALLGNLLFVEELPEGIRSLMLRKSEGNPFFLEEVIRSLIDAGHIVRENGHWRATQTINDVTIPDTLRGLLTARIDRLPDPTKRVAQIAATIGRTFPYDVLVAVSDHADPPERIADPRPHLDTLVMEELVREWLHAPELEYTFKHALTQEAAYDLLLIRRRRAYHRLVGAVLEELYASRLNELAPLIERHFRLGEDWPRAAQYAMRAGTEAERIGALREASEHFDRAYQALKKMPDARPEDLIDAILAWVRTGYKLIPSDAVLARLAEAEATARAADDKRRLALTLNWTGNVHFYLGVPSDGVPALMEGYRLAEELGEEDLVLAWTFLITESLIDQNPRAALGQVARIIELARKNHLEDIEAHAIAMQAMTYARLGDFARAEKAINQALDVVRQIDSPVKEADVHSAAALMAFDMGDVARGLEHSRKAAEEGFSVNGYECAIFGLYTAGMGQLQEGAWKEAREAFEDAARHAELSKVGSEWLKNRIQAGLAMARAQLGDAGAVERMDDTLVRAQAFEDDYTAALLSRSLGESYLRSGDLDRAERSLDAALSYYRRNEMRPYLPRVLRLVADLQERQGESQRAAALREEAERVIAELAA